MGCSFCFCGFGDGWSSLTSDLLYRLTFSETEARTLGQALNGPDVGPACVEPVSKNEREDLYQYPYIFIKGFWIFETTRVSAIYTCL